MIRLKAALAGAESAIIGRLASVALAAAIAVIGWLGAGAVADIKAGIALQRAELGELRDLIASQSATLEALGARLDGDARAQAVIDAGQDRRLGALEARAGRE